MNIFLELADNGCSISLRLQASTRENGAIFGGIRWRSSARALGLISWWDRSKEFQSSSFKWLLGRFQLKAEERCVRFCVLA